jgi:hypothetical protein
MKKKPVKTAALPPAPSADEYRLFQDQPYAVLQSYAVARKSMAVIIPATALVSAVNIYLAAALSLVIGIAGFLLLFSRYGAKGAVTPFLCAVTGTAIGIFLLEPVVTHLLTIRRVFYGL